MYVLVTYDVETKTSAGASRLRKVAKLCVKSGQRVQNSVFECLLTPSEYETLKHGIEKIIDADKDSVRFYNLGKGWRNRVEHLGAMESYDPEGALVV